LTAERCTRPAELSYSLKSLRPETQTHQDALKRHYIEVSGHKLGKRTEANWLPKAIAELPPDDKYVLEYIAGDAVACARLAGLIAERAAKLDDKAANEHEEGKSSAHVRTQVSRLCRADLAWREVSHRGLAVDITGLEEEKERVTAEVEAAAVVEGVDLASNLKATYEWVATRGIKLPTTDKGAPSLSAKVRDQAVVPTEAKEAWAKMCDLRDTAACRGKVDEILRCTDSAGRVHPSIGVNSADRTGRMSISDPALQNLADRLKPYFLADPGMVLVGLDLDSVEPHVTAALSGDEVMRETLRSETDCYMRAAMSAWPEDCVTPEGALKARKRAKPLFLAQEYGQSVDGLSRTQHLSREEAKKLRKSLFAPYPRLVRWLDQIADMAREGEQLWTCGGRPLNTAFLAEYPYKAVNALVQGSAADAFHEMVSVLASRLGEIPGSGLYLPIHDEIVLQVPAGTEQEAVELLEATMRTDIRGIEIGGSATVLGDRLAHA